MTTPVPLSDTDLQGFADRQLGASRAAEVEAALARDPQAAARVADIRAQNQALAQALDPWLAEPIPERLLRAATPPREARHARWLPRTLALAATLLLYLDFDALSGTIPQPSVSVPELGADAAATPGT